MNITTKNKIMPVAKRIAKGIKPTDSQIRLLRDAATEVQEPDFKKLLESAGEEAELSDRRQHGKDLLSQIRYATGARRKNDLPQDNPRPEKIKKYLKQGKSLK